MGSATVTTGDAPGGDPRYYRDRAEVEAQLSSIREVGRRALLLLAVAVMVAGVFGVVASAICGAIDYTSNNKHSSKKTPLTTTKSSAN
jgi:hypothetical protein